MAIFTPRWTTARMTVSARPPKTAIIHAAPHGSRRALSWPSAVGRVWSPKTSPKAETVRSEMRSMRARLRGLRGFAASSGNPGRTPLGALIACLRVEPRKDAVLHRAAEQVHLRRCRPTDLHILHADAVQVFASRGVRDAQLRGDRLQRQAGGVEVEHISLAPAELRLREVTVRVDGRRPLQVVEHVAARDGGDRADQGRRRRGLRDDARRTRGEGLADAGDTVGDAVDEDGRAGRLRALDVVGDL